MGQKTWRGKSAFVAEDEALVAMVLEDMLIASGCTVAASVATLDDAVKQAATVAADFAVLDVNLNGRLSYPAADVLVGRGVPIVFSTGYGASALPERFRGAPVLNKPFQAADLVAALDRLFG